MTRNEGLAHPYHAWPGEIRAWARTSRRGRTDRQHGWTIRANMGHRERRGVAGAPRYGLFSRVECKLDDPHTAKDDFRWERLRTRTMTATVAGPPRAPVWT